MSASTGISPFFADNGFYPRKGTEPATKYEGAGKAEVTRADKLVDRAKAMREYLQEQLAWIQEEQSRHADKFRQPYPAFKVGDKVFVDARDFHLDRKSKSLSLKNLGPWEITRYIDGKAYEVAVPDTMKDRGVHPVFHPWKLHLAPDNPYPR